MVDNFYKPARLYCEQVAVRKIQDGGLESAAHFVLRSYLLRRFPAPTSVFKLCVGLRLIGDIG
jgi:hypothetical protein